MAVYIVQGCIDQIQYIVDFGAATVNLGDVWSFKSSGLLLCGTVLEETDQTPSYNAQNFYTRGCCECYSNSGYKSLKFLDCDGITEYYVSITTFCTGYGSVPIVGKFYKFYTEPAICAQFVDVSSNVADTNMTPLTNVFSSCIECNNKWNAIDCITEETYIMDFGLDFGVGSSQVYSLIVDGNIKCATISELVDSPTGLTPDIYQVTCVVCYIGNGFQSLKFVNCVDNSVYFVDILNFYNTFAFIPLANSVYELYITNNNESINSCFTFTEVVGDSFNTTVDTIVLEYNDCITCTSPKSANTESTVCVICSGNTFTVSPPHPVWTDTKGKAVIQLDAITLGGNGLNS